MEQTITVTLPDTHVLIPKVEFEKLVSNSLPAFWTMEDLIRESKLSRYKIEKRILEVPRFKNTSKKTTFGFEGQGGSSSHYFDAELMWKFLKDYKKEIYKG